MILPMGAMHQDHNKLIRIVHTVEQEGKEGLFDPLHSQYSQATFNRINDIYADNRVDGIIRPIYENVTYAGEEKIDGFSYTCDNGEFFSRKLSEAKDTKGQPICKTDHLPQFDTLKSMATVCQFDVHGELYKPGGTSDDVTRIMGCSADKAVARQNYPEDKLHYMIHDIMEFNGMDLTNEPWCIRRAILEYWYKNYMLENPFIHISAIDHTPMASFHRIVSGGGEGLIFKKTSGLYVPGKKPANNWVKCKKEVTLDVVIMGFNNDGSGKNAGLFKSIIVGLNINGRFTEIGSIHSGISDELRREMHENREKYINNKVIEVDAMDYNGKTFSLRHGRLVRFRDDKNIQDCTPDGVRLKEDIL